MTESNTCELIDVSPELLEKWIAAGDAVVVDVREDFEHASERIDGALNHPLSGFDTDELRRLCGDRRVVFHCRTGGRSSEAAERFSDEGQVFHLQGGIEGWKSSGRGIVRPAGGPRFEIMRQMQMTAGSLVVLGVVLGVWLNPWFLAISAFVGCGLAIAGLTGWCGMAMLLGKMPWNRVGGGGGGACCSGGSCSKSTT